jgi:ribonuclease E
VLLVNAIDPEEIRIALLEDGKLEEIYLESSEERSATGNVYRGRVQNVEKGIGAAFVDMGRGLTGFLHVSDLPERQPGQTIGDLLKEGDEVLVQVTRDSMGKKGPALTARVSLPGRWLVLTPKAPRSGVSRRIEGDRERRHARRLLDQITVPEGMGVIVRTASESARPEDLQQDLAVLLQEWEALKARFMEPGPPGLIKSESDLAERSVRDLMPPDASRIVVDKESIAQRMDRLLGAWRPAGAEAGAPPAPAPEPASAPETLPEPEPPPLDEIGEGVEASPPSPPPPDGSRVEIYREDMPLFHAFGVETQLEEAFRRVLRLPSGGSLVIDPTEALVAIDVNSGRMTEQEDPESTALVTNLEAAAEAARQLRLRDLGGLIVVDFIDMRERRAVRQVEKAFRDALARDRARIRVGRIGQFGCLMLSRQRIRPALTRLTHEECEACGGTGRRRHASGLGLRVLREMAARIARARGRGGLEVRVPEAVRDWIRRHRGSLLRELERRCDGPIRLEADSRIAADGWAMKGLPPTPRP